MHKFNKQPPLKANLKVWEKENMWGPTPPTVGNTVGGKAPCMGINELIPAVDVNSTEEDISAFNFEVEIEINYTAGSRSDDEVCTKQFLVQPEYNNSNVWIGYFAPSLDMETGLYQLRTRTIEDG